jgi:uncharacterized iron-regulated membrane protein
MRKLLLTLHLYAALITGAFVAILGATGSVMAFEDQLDHLSHPHLFYVTPQAAPLSLADLAAAAGRRFPGERADYFGMAVARPFVLRLLRKRQRLRQSVRARCSASGTLRRSSSTVHQFHLRLLAGDIGKKIVSWTGVVILFLLLSGLYLWWPLKRVTITWNAASARVWFDVHNTVGIVSLAFLLVLTLTGLVIGFESVTTPMLFTVTHSEPLKASFRAVGRPGVQRVTPDQAVAAARTALPGAVPSGVNVPGPTGVYRVALPRGSAPGAAAGCSSIRSAAPFSGEVPRTTAAGTATRRIARSHQRYLRYRKAVMSFASLMRCCRFSAAWRVVDRR